MSTLPALESPLVDGVVALRHWTKADVDAMVEALNDSEIVRWTRVPSPYTRADALEFLRRSEEQRQSGEEISLAITGPDAGAALGSISVRVAWEGLRGQVGYLVFPGARGRGVAPRAVRLLAQFGFARLGLARVEIQVATGNPASQRVAEKAGFKREGVLRAYCPGRRGRLDMVSFSLLPDELDSSYTEAADR